MKKRMLSGLLALCLALSLLPGTARAGSVANCSQANCGHVAAIGTTHYDTLQEAADSVTDGTKTTIKLLNDVTVTGKSALRVQDTNGVGRNIVLDLNGKTVSSNYGYYTITVSNDGTPAGSTPAGTACKSSLTIIGSGTITTTNTGTTTIQNYGTLTIGEKNASAFPTVLRPDPTTQANNVAVKCEEDSTLTIYGGTFTCKNGSVQNWGRTKIYGGTFTNEVEAWQWEDHDSTLNISGGTFNGAFVVGTDGTNVQQPTISITGGAFTTADPSDYLADGFEYDENTHTVKQEGEDASDGPVTVTDVRIAQASGDVFVEVGSSAAQLTAIVSLSSYTDPTVSDKVTWASSNEEVVTVDENGWLTGLVPGEATITATSVADPTKSGACEVEVSGIIISESAQELLVGQSYTLTAAAYGNAAASVMTWSTSNMSVAGVKTGRVSGYNPGTAVISATAGSYSASCTVTVAEDVAAAINREMTAGDVLSFAGLISDLNSQAQEKLGTGLEYVTNLSVDTNAGILYYGYTSPNAPGSGVGSSEKYYMSAGSNQRALSDVSFIPSSDFGGTAVISYTGYADGTSFTGTIRVEVKNSGDVAYNTGKDLLLNFQAEDFSTVCRSKTGGNLRYVTFLLPSPSQGTLYYNYSSPDQFSQKVAVGTKYYVAGGSLLLDSVSFLPAEGYTGNVSITYYGTDSSGGAYTGRVIITVLDPDSGDPSGIVYETSVSTPVSFDVSDFNEACQDAVDSNLSYVYFELPDASEGTLYYDYAAASASYDSTVSATTRYFRNTSPRIAYIDFVPAPGYSGTVEIPYTGYSTTGEQFTGTVRIRVGMNEAAVSYTSNEGNAVDFNGFDFNEACHASNGAGLDYIRFELPASSEGTLYSGSAGTKVRANRDFGVSALSNITFEPESGFTGVVYIPFNGYDVNGGPFSGRVKITVTEPQSSSIYYQGSSLPIRFNASDFRGASALPAPLSYICFDSLPAFGGKVMLNYFDSAAGAPAEAGVKYYNVGIPSIDTLSFVAKAGFQGTVTIPYTAVDTSGNSVSDTIQIYVSNNYLDTYFTDLGGYGWAAPSIEFLRYNEVTYGYGNGTYGPGDSISRGQFVTMLCRLFDFDTRYTTNFPDVPAGSYYANSVMTAKALGIVTGSGGYFKPDSLLTRQEAVVMITRAMDAAGKSVASASTTLLDMYSDGGKVAGYARSAMASMVRAGVLNGGSDGSLSPEKAITRAEMAVLLHRVSTL